MVAGRAPHRALRPAGPPARPQRERPAQDCPPPLPLAPGSLTGAPPAPRPQSVDEEKHWCLGYPLYAGGSLWEALVCRNGEKPLTVA